MAAKSKGYKNSKTEFKSKSVDNLRTYIRPYLVNTESATFILVTQMLRIPFFKVVVRLHICHFEDS